MRVVRRPRFLDDLYDAYAWIASDSETAAERLLDRVDAGLNACVVSQCPERRERIWRPDYARSD